VLSMSPLRLLPLLDSAKHSGTEGGPLWPVVLDIQELGTLSTEPRAGVGGDSLVENYAHSGRESKLSVQT